MDENQGVRQMMLDLCYKIIGQSQLSMIQPVVRNLQSALAANEVDDKFEVRGPTEDERQLYSAAVKYLLQEITRELKHD